MARRQIFACADWRVVRALGVSVVLAFSTVDTPSRVGARHTVPELASAVQGKLATLGAVGAPCDRARELRQIASSLGDPVVPGDPGDRGSLRGRW